MLNFLVSLIIACQLINPLQAIVMGVEVNQSVAPHRRVNYSFAPLINAPSVLVLDVRSGKILFQKNGFVQRPMASITKLMTAVVFLKQQPAWETYIPITDNDKLNGGRILLTPGMKIKIRDLFQATLIGSLNNGATALARASGLSQTDFINEHLLWMRNNMNSFLSKHHIMGNNRINLVCLYGGKEEINLEVPDMKGEIKIYNFNIALTGSGEYQQFNNYTLNIQLIRKMLSDISNSGLDESAKGLFNEIFTQRPLIGWKKAANCSVVDTLKEKYWLYFFRNFFLCHKGKAPFNPKKVLFKEELW